MYVFNMPMPMVIAGIVLILLFLCIYKCKKYADKHVRFYAFLYRYNTLLAIAGLAVLFILQIVLAQAIYRPIGWDCGAIVECAVKGDLTSERFYFSTYPNNLLMFCILKYLLKAFFYFGGQNYWLFLSVVNIVLVDISIYLVFAVCKKLFSLACGFVSYTLFILIFGLSPWLVVPYSDTFAMLFSPLILLLFVKFRETEHLFRKGILLFLIGFVSVFAYFIKPYTLIVLIAIVLYFLVHSINSIKKIGIFLLTALILFVGAAGSYFTYNAAVKEPYSKILDYSQSMPMSYFFMMGLNTATSGGTGRTLYGSYNGDDNLFAYSLPTPQKAKDRDS